MNKFKEKLSNAWSKFEYWLSGGSGKFGVGQAFTIGLMVLLPILLIIMTPWLFGYAFPKYEYELTIATIAIGIAFFLAFVVLLFIQSASNKDISKMTKEDWKDLFKFKKNRPQ